jgi:hypothetical protein
MRLISPFDRFSTPAQKRILVIALILSATLLATMRILDQPLRTPDAPRGIVSFELAKNMAASRQIMDSWNQQATQNAVLSLGLDYLFLVVYAVFISAACVQVGKAFQHRNPLISSTGNALAWAQFLAAILDAVENLALIALLLDSERMWLPAMARVCAIVKFSIVGAGLIFIVGGLIVIGLEGILKKA